MNSEWEPANEVERELVAALEAGDSKRYAEIVLGAPLYLPVLPEPGSELRQDLDEFMPLDRAHVLAFTSPEALSHGLGPYSLGHREADVAALARNWPGPDHQFALNPGLPIGAVLPLDALSRLADGSESLIPVDAAEAALAEQVRAEIRELCLAELSGGVAPGVAAPVNELEEALAAAVEGQDVDAFLSALVDSEVVVPMSGPVSEDFDGTNFPWLRIGPAIPVFSSTEVLSRTAAHVAEHIELPFLAAAANWPGREHVLCFNPGSGTELIMSGAGVEELVETVAEMLSENPDALNN
ncbi:SseB family protein [Saccharopolyspora sp. K220]|uniref:SseB family protein n=1 Tax=Saccharopolyspora soli TaxID=2926618 RepID=UPI001F5723B0|nr:SseB family protein [Saccharopolyspora soli]MCI2421201.1 SseB family protein [Saccharopolyspora soli]